MFQTFRGFVTCVG